MQDLTILMIYLVVIPSRLLSLLGNFVSSESVAASSSWKDAINGIELRVSAYNVNFIFKIKKIK